MGFRVCVHSLDLTEKLTEQLLNVSLISFRSLQLRTSSEYKNCYWNEGSPTLDTTELCARRATQPVQSQYAFFQFDVQGWVRAKLIWKQGMEEKLVKWEEGKGWLISTHPVTARTGLVKLKLSSLKTWQTAVCFQVEVVLLSGALLTPVRSAACCSYPGWLRSLHR